MLTQQEEETRLEYLSRVLTELMTGIAGEETINYDGTTCDGACLAEDIASEISMLKGGKK